MEPKIETRPEQPYAGIRETTAADGIAGVVDRGFPELFGWLAERGIAPAAAPFIRYHATGPELDLELGVPVAAPVDGGGRIAPATLPPGRWLTVVHVGPYGGLPDTHAELEDWARAHGVAFAPGGMVEHYRTDPSAEPDAAKWETEIARLIA